MDSPTKKRDRKGFVVKILLALLVLSFLFLLIGGVGFYLYLSSLKKELPDVSHLDRFKPALTTKIVSTDGQVVGTLFEEDRVWTSLDKVSPYVSRGLLATEDSRFYEHGGVDFIGVARVGFDYILHQGLTHGASTITQQLARRVFLTNDPTFTRKFKEWLIAWEIEKRYTKQEILEFYLNQVYFGEGAYGIHAASNRYFRKSAADLDIAESAMIVGLLQAPSRYDPYIDKDAMLRRLEEVLGRMVDLEYISEAEREMALAEAQAWTFSQSQSGSREVFKYPYHTGYVIYQLSQLFSDEELYREGLYIATALDPELQRYAEQRLTALVDREYYALGVSQGALALIENETGLVRALVGGVHWSKDDQFNRAWQTQRQPGSSFKPIVYSAALEAGYSPSSIVYDTKVSYPDGAGGTWTPKNSDRRYMGRLTLAKAVAYSRNVVAVKVLSAIGVEPVIQLAYEMGLDTKIPENLSVALGAVSASPLEMATVFSVIANKGRLNPPKLVQVVKDHKGALIKDFRETQTRQVLTESTASGMTQMLRGVVEFGTGENAQVAGVPIAGKTGTTDDFRDAWFVGFSPKYTCAVWVGNDDNSKMYSSYGGYLPALIFHDVMDYAHRGLDPGQFPGYTEPDPVMNFDGTQNHPSSNTEESNSDHGQEANTAKEEEGEGVAESESQEAPIPAESEVVNVPDPATPVEDVGETEAPSAPEPEVVIPDEIEF